MNKKKKLKPLELEKELLQVVKLLEQEKAKIQPPKALLSKILSDIHQEEIKGRSLIQPVFEEILDFMEKKVYVLAGAGIVVLIILAGVYWYSQKTGILFFEKQAGDIEEQAGEQAGKVETSEIAGLEKELNQELESFAQDFDDLSSYEADTSLNNLDASLGGI